VEEPLNHCLLAEKAKENQRGVAAEEERVAAEPRDGGEEKKNIVDAAKQRDIVEYQNRPIEKVKEMDQHKETPYPLTENI
jgi:hypothetical protein